MLPPLMPKPQKIASKVVKAAPARKSESGLKPQLRVLVPASPEPSDAGSASPARGAN